jgi:hypothetical protein
MSTHRMSLSLVTFASCSSASLISLRASLVEDSVDAYAWRSRRVPKKDGSISRLRIARPASSPRASSQSPPRTHPKIRGGRFCRVVLQLVYAVPAWPALLTDAESPERLMSSCERWPDLGWLDLARARASQLSSSLRKAMSPTSSDMR